MIGNAGLVLGKKDILHADPTPLLCVVDNMDKLYITSITYQPDQTVGQEKMKGDRIDVEA